MSKRHETIRRIFDPMPRPVKMASLWVVVILASSTVGVVFAAWCVMVAAKNAAQEFWWTWIDEMQPQFLFVRTAWHITFWKKGKKLPDDVAREIHSWNVERYEDD